MSTMNPGAGSPEFEKLIQLATFVQGTGYLERVKELRDLEASAKAALEAANTTIALCATAEGNLARREEAVKQKETALAAAQQAHDKRVAGLSKAVSDFR